MRTDPSSRLAKYSGVPTPQPRVGPQRAQPGRRAAFGEMQPTELADIPELERDRFVPPSSSVKTEPRVSTAHRLGR